MRARTRVPPPGRERIETWPPTASILSRMLASPIPARHGALVEAVAVVAHLQRQRVVVVGELDDDHGRVACVLGRVLQRLETAEEGRGLDLGRVPADRDLEHGHGQRGAARGRAQRVGETQFGRQIAACERADLVQRLVDLGSEAAHEDSPRRDRGPRCALPPARA